MSMVIPVGGIRKKKVANGITHMAQKLVCQCIKPA